MLKVRNLACERDNRLLFSELSFDLDAGDILQIEGQNGSGKTSLLRILCGLANSCAGEISWKNIVIQDNQAEYFEALLYIGHLPGIKSTLTAEENLRWFQNLQPNLNKGSLSAALNSVGLYGFEDLPCYALSAGQQRRVGLARLYLSNHPLWILDEPFTALDKQGVAEKEQLILRHAERGGSVILTTHHEFDLPGQTLRRINLDQLAAV